VSKKNDVYAFGITLLETVGSIRMFKPPGECRLDEWVSIKHTSISTPQQLLIIDSWLIPESN